MKTKLFTLAAVFFCCITASAQVHKDYMPYPYTFIGLQGGIQYTLGNKQFPQKELITPVGGLQIGRMFTPVFGLRFHVMGINGRVTTKKIFYPITQPATKADYKFVNGNIDIMINLNNLIYKDPYKPRFLDLYFIAGLGLNYTWDIEQLPNYSQQEENRISHNIRGGLMLEGNISRNLGINLEVGMNQQLLFFLRQNPKSGYNHNWQLTAMLGVRYKFKYKYRKPAPTIIPTMDELVDEQGAETATAPVVVQEEKPAPPVIEPEPVPVVQQVETPAPVFIPEENTVDLFFQFNKTDIDSNAANRLRLMGNWLKSRQNSHVVVTGYADKGTGNPKRNMMLSEQRANTVADQLVNEYGFERSKIVVDFKGDTVQPYSENDQNRLVRIEAKTYEIK